MQLGGTAVVLTSDILFKNKKMDYQYANAKLIVYNFDELIKKIVLDIKY